MNNKEIQLTDLEREVLEDFCEYSISNYRPMPTFLIEIHNNSLLEEVPEILKGLQTKGLIKSIQTYNTTSLNQILSGIVGYIPTDKLKNAKLYKTIEKRIKYRGRY